MNRTRSSSHAGGGRASRRSQRGSWRRERGNGASNASSSGSEGWKRHGTALPGWTDLEPAQNRRRRESGDTFLENVSTGRFGLALLVIAGLFTLYVGHVHATTDLYGELQQARTENQRLHLKHNRLKGAFDRRTGPSVIYERARELGLRESVTYGRPVSVE